MRAVAIVIAIGLIAGITVQTLRVSKLQALNAELQQQLAATRQAAEDPQNNPRPPPAPAVADEERTELLRLRNQAAQLKQATNEVKNLRAQLQQLQTAQAQFQPAPAPGAFPSPTASPAVPREAWAFAGYATPENALQSGLFAMSQGDFQTFLASLTPEEAQKMQKSFEGKTPEQLAQEGQREMAKLKSFQVVNREEVAPDRVVLHVYASGEDRVQRMVMQKIGDEWKWAGGPNRRRVETQATPQQ